MHRHIHAYGTVVVAETTLKSIPWMNRKGYTITHASFLPVLFCWPPTGSSMADVSSWLKKLNSEIDDL